jgi:hypothetical protein
MKSKIIKPILFLIVISTLASCAIPKNTTTLVGGEYNPTKNITNYFVFPYGSVSIPGKWNKTHYNSVSRQQFFTNQDSSVKIAIAFERYNNYEFNKDGAHTGYNFLKAYYEWDSKYFIDVYGLKRQPIETDSINNYLIYRLYGQTKKEKEEFDSYFLIGEKNGNISNLLVCYSDKWTEAEKIQFLKNLFLVKKEE